MSEFGSVGDFEHWLKNKANEPIDKIFLDVEELNHNDLTTVVKLLLNEFGYEVILTKLANGNNEIELIKDTLN